jgi:DNA adenine methylase
MGLKSVRILKMPTYGGGKSKIGRKLSEIIKLKVIELNMEKCDYFEPFCGCLGVFKHMLGGSHSNYIANDINENIILMWESIKDGWILPDVITKEEFKLINKSEISSREKGFYGITCSYSGIFGARYRVKYGKIDFFRRSKDDLMRIGEKIITNSDHITFHSQDYRNFNPMNMVIYCDPPYLNNRLDTKYFNDFDTDKFWETMRIWSLNNLVIISEYEAPCDFECIYELPINTTFSGKSIIRNEKLFILRPSNFVRPAIAGPSFVLDKL